MMREPKGCRHCGRACRRSVWMTAPPRWLRIVSPRNGDVLLLCPSCKARALNVR